MERQDLTQFGPVIDALKQVAIESNVDNGTYGQTYRCYLWDHETVMDKDRRELSRKLNKAKFKNDRKAVEELTEEISKLKEPDKILIFRLLEPIPYLKGTKPIVVEKKKHRMNMNNVEYIYVHQNTIQAKLLSFVLTGEKALDDKHRETDVIDLTLDKCLLDVREPRYSYGTMMRDKTAMVTEIAYSVIQTITRMDRVIADKLRGYDVED